MKNIICPACHSEFNPSATSCPVCLRPRSRREIIHDIISIQQAPIRRRHTLLRVAAFATLAAAGLDLAWQNRGHWISPSQPPTAVSPPQAAPPLHEAPLAAPKLKNPPPKPAACLVRGTVYDLLTLKPVPGAQVIFTARSSGRSVHARTDSAGRYTLNLARSSEGGFEAAIIRKDYPDKYLEENDPPYRTMGLKRRQEAADLFLESAVLHVPFLGCEEEDRPRYDLVLVPPSAL